jgi:hypothetical protein
LGADGVHGANVRGTCRPAITAVAAAAAAAVSSMVQVVYMVPMCAARGGKRSRQHWCQATHVVASGQCKDGACSLWLFTDDKTARATELA